MKIEHFYKYTRRFLGIVIFLLGVTCAAMGQKIFTKTYSDIPGVSSNVFFKVEQSDDGAMWFVTQLGLVRYDGVSWRLCSDSLGLPVREYSDLIALNSGGIATAGLNAFGEKMLSVYTNKKWTSVPIPGTKTISDRYVLWENNTDIHLVHSNGDSLYLYSVKNKKWQSKPLKDKSHNFSEIENIRIHNNQIYLITKSGIFKSTNFPDFTRLQLDTSQLTGPFYHDLSWSNSGDTLFVLGTNYLGMQIQNKGKKLVQNNLFTEMQGRTSSKILYDFPFVYYTCSSPLYAYDFRDNSAIEIHGHGQEGRTRWNSIKIDRQGILWMAGHRGLSKIPSLAFTNYTDGYFIEDEVSVVRHLKNGDVFIGHNIGFSVLDKDKKIKWSHTFDHESPLIRILDAVETSDGSIYAAASDNGLIKINNQTQKVETIQGVAYAATVQQRGDTLWVGSPKGVIRIFQDKTIDYTKTIPVRRLQFDPKGDLYVLSNLGVQLFHPGAPVQHENQYDDRQNTYTAATYEGKFLIATTGGLYFYKDGNFTPFLVGGKHFDQPVYTFVEGSNGELWLGTGHGVYQIKDHKILNHYISTNGLVSNEINRAAMEFDADSNLWIGSDKGLTILTQKRSNPINLPPKVAITSISNAGIKHKTDQPLQLNYKNRNVVFHFNAHSFYSESSINFEYKLEGYDKNWIQENRFNLRKVKYENLPPGTYFFKIRARESKRAWSTIASSELIRVKAPLYFSIWFIVGSILALIILVAIATTLWNQKKLAANLDTQLKVKMKEVIASQQKLSHQNEELSKLNTELDSFVYSVSHDLRAPIASSLGLINLIKMDGLKAEEYIDLIETSMKRMDSFIKDILEVSRNSRKEVSYSTFNIKLLIEEVIDQQKFRKGVESIQFEMDLSPSSIVSDKKRIYVILTNLISNAISYTDLGKENNWVKIKGNLDKNGQYVLTVEDNGVGIKNSHLPQLFDIFYRASETTAGSGLGLYITDQTIHKLGGTIAVASKYGYWTKFTLQFPLGSGS